MRILCLFLTTILLGVAATAAPLKRSVLKTDLPRTSRPRPEIEPRAFPAHTTQTARTRPMGKVSYRPAPGFDIAEMPFFANTLSVAIFPRMELGTIPVFYLMKEHVFNVTGKLNFYRGDELNLGFGYTFITLKYDMQSDEEINQRTAYLNAGWFALLSEYRPYRSRLFYSLNINSNPTYFHYGNPRGQTPNLYFDLGVRVTRNFSVTPGGSYSHPNFQSWLVNWDLPEKVWGFGTSVSWTSPGSFISLFSIGAHHYPQVPDTRYLMSLGFR